MTTATPRPRLISFTCNLAGVSSPSTDLTGNSIFFNRFGGCLTNTVRFPMTKVICIYSIGVSPHTEFASPKISTQRILLHTDNRRDTPRSENQSEEARG
ncbi:hypothetical protein L1987_47085 [Smallanthus sonchifolius]|uniref:Uncharacterized protein n=1 Tax=Smallanthus sonchifolius TaxID=185202 RepID=A0ACB9G2J0_9ASTR|nr:hypothetical protein L1987_47085 [Smallanthus sonchifolius]